jgi:hypothetical protein
MAKEAEVQTGAAPADGDHPQDELETGAAGTDEQGHDAETTEELAARTRKELQDKGDKSGEEEEGADKGGETVEIDTDDITTDEDGSFRLVVDPEDPKSTVYVGKTMKELFSNIKNGIKEKDKVVHKLRSEALSVEQHRGKKGKAGDAEELVGAPKLNELLVKVARERGVDAKMLGWTDADWTAYAEENSLRDFQVTKIMSRVDAVRDIAQAEYNDGTVTAINDSTLDSEHEQVKALVAKKGLNDEFTPDLYNEVLSRVLSDEKNFKKSGIRREGVVVAAVAEELLSLYASKQVKDAKRKADEDIASGRERKAGLTSTGQSRETFKGPKGKPAANLDDAAERAIADYKSGKFK